MDFVNMDDFITTIKENLGKRTDGYIGDTSIETVIFKEAQKRLLLLTQKYTPLSLNRQVYAGASSTLRTASMPKRDENNFVVEANGIKQLSIGFGTCITDVTNIATINDAVIWDWADNKTVFGIPGSEILGMDARIIGGYCKIYDTWYQIVSVYYFASVLYLKFDSILTQGVPDTVLLVKDEPGLSLKPLTKLTESMRGQLFPDGKLGKTDAGTPLYYTEHLSARNILNVDLYPRPQTDYILSASVLVKPAPLTLHSEMELPVEWVNVLEAFVTATCFFKQQEVEAGREWWNLALEFARTLKRNENKEHNRKLVRAEPNSYNPALDPYVHSMRIR